MIRLRDAYLLVVLCLVPIALVSMFINHQKDESMLVLEKQRDQERHLFFEKEKGYLSLLKGGLSSISTPFVWPEGRALRDQDGVPEIHNDNPFVVLFFGELSCNACQERLT